MSIEETARKTATLAERGYANPEKVVTTGWLVDRLDDETVKVVEVDVDTAAYEEGHIPGAVGWNWRTQLTDPKRRDLASREAFQDLLRRSGIRNSDTVVLYGDHHNWFAAWALWELEYYGHRDVRLLDGGRARWIDEGLAFLTEVPDPEPSDYRVRGPFESLRAYRHDVERAVALGLPLVDVRSPAEFSGEVIAPPGLPETAQRGGHIPGARNIPWSRAVGEDGTFLPAEQLRRLYAGEQGVTEDAHVITYCRIGERSAHSWFVLRHLLGYPDVRNYDGSWTEWGNLVGAPIET